MTPLELFIQKHLQKIQASAKKSTRPTLSASTQRKMQSKMSAEEEAEERYFRTTSMGVTAACTTDTPSGKTTTTLCTTNDSFFGVLSSEFKQWGIC
ncbi:hypothetical protein V7S43_004438 [Phytophthora oleae]|uniref:Uncharacterized protein n=1 Tax=Phytophthora oleae TaxID=2107226 RepID=A0ABD3FTS5_9STRA